MLSIIFKINQMLRNHISSLKDHKN
jgi:hypothetical protein